ncbi:unnamed protein product, partial [Effrenium voratum]
RPNLGRAGTAPARALDPEFVDGFDPEFRIEPPSEDSAAKKLVYGKKRPSLHRFDTPDLWEQQMMLEADADFKETAVPKVQTTPEAVAQAIQAAQVSHGTHAVATPALEGESRAAPELKEALALPAQSAAPMNFGQVAMLLVAPVVCPPLQVSPVSSPSAPSRGPPQDVPDQPRLLGRVASPRPEGAEKPRGVVEADQTLVPGALDQITTETGSTKIRWCVDGQKLESHAEKLISPEFKLGVPGQESQPFRIMILANQTGGKHGAGFKKAKGRSTIEIKCLGSFEGPATGMLVTVGFGSRKQKARELVRHSFAEKSCCPLPKGRDPVWDLKAALCKETKCVDICIEILPFL